MEVQPLKHAIAIAPPETPPPPSPSGSPPRKPRRRRNICLACGGVTLVIIILLVILSLTVFKAKKPKITIASMTLQDLQFSPNLTMFRVYINITLGISVVVKNPNIIGMKYTNSSAFLKYRGQVVGEVPIPAGKIGADDTRTLNVTLTLLADRLVGNATVFSDVVAGTFPVVTDTRISGKVKILFFKLHVVSTTSCPVDIYLGNGTIGQQNCRSKIKL